MKKIYVLFVLLLMAQVGMNAQGKGNWKGKRGGNGPATKIPVKGKIVDADSDLPLEFATITLFSQRDSSVVTGGISDDKGHFLLESRPGRFYAKIEFISYQSKMLEHIAIEKGSLAKDMGTITLSLDAATLSEVEVRAEKSQMQMSLDKKVFNVGKDLANRGGTAADILDNVPSVTVDIEGNVELRGSGNVRILIDGKPSGMLGSDNNGLRQLPSNLIERIEVITNPSARYEAEGMAGIINIVLRKETGGGFNGSFDFTLGYPEQYGTAINLNYRKNNFNFFANYGITYRRAPGGGIRHQEFNPNADITQITDQIRDRVRGGWSNSIRLGADYYFNDKNILTTSFLYKKGKEDNVTDLEYADFEKTGTANPIGTGITERTDNEVEDEANLEYALDYKKTFDRKGQELNVSLTYMDKSEEENSDLVNVFLNSDRNPTGIPNEIQRSNNDEGQKLLRLQVDYVHPFSKDHQLEFGGLGSIRTIKNDYLVEEWVDEKWLTFDSLSNQFRYNENIYSVYASYSNKIQRFSYQVGIRGEYSDVKTESIENQSINQRNYFTPIPTVHLSYELPNQHSIQLSYSRRIRRPRFRDLNPFFSFSDERNFFSGNPDLDPELTNSFELSHIKYFDKGSISSSIYYRHTTNVIQRIKTFNPEDGTTATRPENLASRDNMGLEFTFSYNPIKWWRMNGNLNLFRSITEGGVLDADTYSWFTRVSNKMTLFKSLDFQLTFNYRAPRETTQGQRRSMWTLDLGLSKEIFKKNGTLTLSARDLFNTRKRRWTIENPDFFEEGEFQWRSRQITLNFNYRLNQKKRKGRSRGNSQGGGQDGGDF